MDEQAARGQPAATRERPARRRSARLVVGAVILAAVGLLWPFADWNWWPVVAGIGALAGLYVTRLDVLLRGWAPHLAGLVTVVLLLGRTGPWVWGFAVGLAVLGYGLVRLPDWRAAAAGVALTAAFGAGYGVSQYRTEAVRAAEQARASTEQAANVMAMPAELVLPSMSNSVAGGDARTACALLGSLAARQFAEAHTAPDCAAAVRALTAQVADPARYRSSRLPPGAVVKRPDGASVDACGAYWGSADSGGTPGSGGGRVSGPATPAPGPKLGRFEMRRYQGDRFLIVGYSRCR